MRGLRAPSPRRRERLGLRWGGVRSLLPEAVKIPRMLFLGHSRLRQSGIRFPKLWAALAARPRKEYRASQTEEGSPASVCRHTPGIERGGPSSFLLSGRSF